MSQVTSLLNYNNVTGEQIIPVGLSLSTTLQDLGINPDNTVVIGHSLGTHVAGIAGNDYQQKTGNLLDLIIGLEASGVVPFNWNPFDRTYANNFNSHALNQGDVKKVVGIHSSNFDFFISLSGSTESLGDYSAYGDLDIYLYTNNFKSDASGSGLLLGSIGGRAANEAEKDLLDLL